MESPSTHPSLLLLLASGEDPEAWQVFHERYGELIRDYGRRRGLQASDCDDLLQTVLLSLTKALPAFRYDPEKGSLRGYLKTIALRAISKDLGQNRPQTVLGQLPEPSHDQDAHWESAWRAHHVRRALARLSQVFPERTLNAFRLYVLEERDPVQVAERLGLSVDSVYQSKTRVMQRLPEIIKSQVEEEG